MRLPAMPVLVNATGYMMVVTVLGKGGHDMHAGIHLEVGFIDDAVRALRRGDTNCHRGAHIVGGRHILPETLSHTPSEVSAALP